MAETYVSGFSTFVTFLENTMANAAETSITSLRLQDQS